VKDQEQIDSQALRVIIPCLNEEPAIGSLVGSLLVKLDRSADRVIVVDNGSSDRTAEVARAAGAEVVPEPKRGYGRACLAGVCAAGNGIAVFLDGDAADDPDDLQRVIEPLRAGSADLVVGVRSHREPGSMTHFQRFGNRLATGLISLLFGTRVTDLGPMRAIRVNRLLAMQSAARTYGWSTEMTIKALRAGYRYLEVPVRHRRRIGRSKVSGNLPASLGAGATILWTVVRWSRWRPKVAVQ
jgi:glycosyltransferase involved in cell wall biosynthesis